MLVLDESVSRATQTQCVSRALRTPSQPLVDDRDMRGRGEADGELVVAGGQSAVMFQEDDAVFDRVPIAISGRVERGWSNFV